MKVDFMKTLTVTMTTKYEKVRKEGLSSLAKEVTVATRIRQGSSNKLRSR